ncbi:uncharacterized protein LOC128246062 [Mya arenaria]|uniref:uncharacterized protein LOC128246062 n=1 Tax=Mya arenaria TaxID=6604 RepID=UPI0022E0E720|nr:uncharacterized protein LOC128246062 [Mya arenaria]
MITKATVDQEKKNINIVLFDLKTTCLGKKAEIIQLAARSDVTSSSRYFLPDGDIDPKASNVISLTVKRDRNGNRYLCKNGQDMEAGNINDGKLCTGISSITPYMANKIANSGLSYEHMQLAHNRNPECEITEGGEFTHLKLGSNRQSYNGAKTLCKAGGYGDLAIIDTEAEYDRMRDYFNVT